MRPWILILALILLPTFLAMSSPWVHAAAALEAAEPLYTQRDKQVTVTGSGYSGGTTYYLWLQEPDENSTKYTSVTFAPVTGGYIPPNVQLPIPVNAIPGTYLISVSTSSATDTAVAKAHFGLWGTLSPLYQRTQLVKVMGGGIFPGSSFRLTIRNPAGTYVDDTSVVSNAVGDFNITWRIPPDGVTDVYTIFIDGTGTYDNPQQDYLSATRFSVTTATLSPKISSQPNPIYQRTDAVKVAFVVQYPDGSPVVNLAQNTYPVVLLRNQTTVANATVSLTDNINGIWSAQVKILPNSTLGSNFRFDLPAMSFDDGFGNRGGTNDTYSNFFEIQNATLSISSQVNGTQIQVPFGQISIISKISYPDGTPFTNGTAQVTVSSGTMNSTVQLSYDPTISAWRGAYSSSITDLGHVGTWTLHVRAYDAYGNSAENLYEVTAQPYLFIGVMAVLIIILLFGRWIFAKFGRKVYFRTRKTIQRFRRREL